MPAYSLIVKWPQNRARKIKIMWDWWQQPANVKRWHMSLLWSLLVAVAAATGYQYGMINANSRFDATVLDGIRGIEQQLDVISDEIKRPRQVQETDIDVSVGDDSWRAGLVREILIADDHIPKDEVSDE